MLITEWDAADDGQSHEYNVLNNEVAAALETIGLETVDAILWGQGESNAHSDPAAYKSVFLQVAANMGAETWGHNAPILVMELPQNTDLSAMNAVHSQWDETEPAHIVTAHSDGLSVDSSGVHFTGEALQEMGYVRMWDAWQRVLASK